MTEKLRLSAAIITKNEEDRIGRCLDSVASIAEDIVVIDSGSTDATVEIARSRGARVFVEDWHGFGAQKRMAVERAAHDMVLLMDADEALSPEAADDIRRAFAHGPAEAYSFPRKAYIADRWVRHCGWWPDRIVRLFDRRTCRIEGDIHESVIVPGSAVELNGHLEHYSFRSYAHMLEKVNTYSDQTSNDLLRRGRAVNAFSPLLHGGWMFFRTYIIRLGVLDGLDGLMVAATTGMGAFLKYAKYLEKKRKKDK